MASKCPTCRDATVDPRYVGEWEDGGDCAGMFYWIIDSRGEVWLSYGDGRYEQSRVTPPLARHYVDIGFWRRRLAPTTTWLPMVDGRRIEWEHTHHLGGWAYMGGVTVRFARGVTARIGGEFGVLYAA